MMSFTDPSLAVLAACGGDTVKIFDVSVESDRDPCTLSYSPSPGFQVNAVKWNHTNLVVASGGDDKKISLWRKNGQSIGTLPISGVDSGDGIEESILAISFGNKGSRYLCSGGTGQVVRIWDLQRKRCIKWLKGHSDTITGAMYNCKDEHLASISLRGDLILHYLASGTRATELKDPNDQVLRVLDYSRISRHLLVTAGDDGSVHLWDTTRSNPKVSWLKQHSAPTTGVSFSPSNDKIIACVGLDKKLYTLDSGTKKPAFCIPYEAPFSSLAFRDDGWILAAGTNNGRVVFYDVRGKLQPISALRAYSNSEAIISLCWQRSKPIIVNESNCTAETALLGGAGEDSILMPDPLPSVTSSSLSLPSLLPGSRNPGRSSVSVDSSSLTTTSSGSILSALSSSTVEETPHKNHLWTGGTLSRLHAPRTSNFKDDMEVFSPLVDVQPITPSLDKLWDDNDDAKKDNLSIDKKPTSHLFPSSIRKFPFTEEACGSHPIFDWKSNSSYRQDDPPTSLAQFDATPASSKSEDSLPTPPEAWGGENLSDKFDHLRQQVTLPSRFGMLAAGSFISGSISGSQSSSSSASQMSTSALTSAGLSYTNLHTKDLSSNIETSAGFTDNVRFSSISNSLGTKSITGQGTHESLLSSSLTLPRRYSTYAERISTTSAFSDRTALASGSPKAKKTGVETSSSLLRSDMPNSTGMGTLPTMNGVTSQPHRGPVQSDAQQGTSSFTLQLIQRTLEETLTSVQKSMHDDMRNLHIELLRQFHIHETEMSSFLNSVLEKQAELMKEVQSLRKENQQLRQML